MPGDYTQSTFQPFRDFRGVHMQQGRVMLDADFNELADLLDRRFRAETNDIIGRCVVPRETIDGFRIQAGGASFTIGRGRLYADGLLAENHGLPPLEFDRVLEEQRGTQPTPYEQQPYLPNAATLAPIPANAGTMLVYADVWEREVTHLEEPDLVEKAVGVDTATRRQVVWQVRALPRVGAITCSTPAEQIPGWLDIIRPSAGRLTTSTAGVPVDTDPCVVNPAGGYRGIENRLYRIEVHAGGVGQASFKWSRDNASIGAAVTAINAGRDILTLSRIGRDAVARIQVNDWIEVTDDHRELYGQPGEMRKVLLVDEVNRTVTLTAALPAGMFDVANPASRHTRVRRWDQKGLVFDALNNVVADVDASGGVIPIPSSGAMILEDGVQVEFSLADPVGSYHTGDYWLVAARTVDASIDILTAAPPKGIHHHFCRLAVVTLPQTVIDCRTLWPPPFGDRGCDCTECVSAESHNSGAFTIQMAIDRVRATGGKVCLGPGLFNLGITPVLLNALQSVQLEGRGWRTILVYAGDGPALFIAGSMGVEIRGMSVVTLAREQPGFAVGILNSALVTVERCLLAQLLGARSRSAAIALSGFVLEARIQENILMGNTGVLSLAAGPTDAVVDNRPATLLMNFRCEQNLIIGREMGIRLSNLTLYLAETRIAENVLTGSATAGIAAAGFVGAALLTSSRVDIIANSIQSAGDGIIAGLDNARVSENDIGVVARREPATGGSGIVVPRAVGGGIERLQVFSNRISRVGGDGIRIAGEVTSAAIKHNVIDGVGGGGIVMQEEASAGQLSIENNQILRSGLRNDPQTQLAAIRVSRVNQLDIAANSIDQYALAAVQNPARTAIDVFACRSVRICGNDLSNLAPPQFVKTGAGILVRSPFDRVDVVDNSVRRSTGAAVAGASGWIAVSIAQALTAVGGTPAPATGLLFPFVISSDIGFIALGATSIVQLPAGREMVAVRGNLLETFGPSPVVDIQVGVTCVFGDNRCLLEAGTGGNTPVALITCRAAVVNANFLRRTPAGDQFAALVLNVGNGPFTAVGNIFNGVALVNGAGLAAPWAPINAFVFN